MSDRTQQGDVTARTPSTDRIGSLVIDPKNFDVMCILGTPCFACGRIAEILRLGGANIAKKAEDEQAHVIVWMLTKHQAYGSTWKSEADKELRELVKANTEIRRGHAE